MKTTINISDNLFAQIKKIAKQKDITFKEILESAIRLFLNSQRNKTETFKFKLHTFKGKGLQDGIKEGNWKDIKKRIYQGRGG